MAIKVECIDNRHIGLDDIVSLKTMGNNYEICYCQHKNRIAPITKINKNTYINNKTGEVKQSKHIKNRSQNKAQVSQSLKRLREYINTNVVEVKNCKWVTLTYSENMTDNKQLMEDFNKFVKRLKYKYKGKYNIEYIGAMEPQLRGAWHCHLILIFNKKAPFISNDEMALIWGHGFTKTQNIDANIDDIGAYLTAYLGDMSLDEVNEYNIEYDEKNIKEIKDSNKHSKYYVKGARLELYPPKFNIYRISRGIKKPKKEYMKYKDAKKKIGLLQPTYSKTIQITDVDKDFTNIIIYEYYNLKRSKNCFKNFYIDIDNIVDTTMYNNFIPILS